MKINTLFTSFWWPIVIFAAVLAYVITMILSVGQSIWFDEGYSILLAKSSWNDLFALTAVDAHPPLYYALLKVWGSIFGFEEFALRSLSAVFLSGSIVVAAALLRKMFSAKVALMVLPFIVFAPFLLRYGYEVRMYTMALFIGVSATYALVVAYQNNNWWRWLVYAALVALGMYTLYMTMVIWLAHLVWLLIQSFKKPRQNIFKTRWVYAYGMAVVLFAVYIPTFVHQMLNSALPGIGKEITLTRLVDILTVLFTFKAESQINGWLSLLLLAALVMVGVVGVKVYKYLTATDKKYYTLLVCLVLVPLAFYALTSLPPKEPIFVNRYLAHVALFIYALLGVTLAFGIIYKNKFKKTKNLPIIAYIVTFGVIAIGVFNLHVAGNFVFERWQLPQTQQVRNSITCTNEMTIVADDPYTYIDSVFYFENCNLHFYNPENVAKKGGYAPLHNSVARVASASEIDSPVLVRLGWNGAKASFVPDNRYELTNSVVYGSQLVETYRLIAE